VRRRQKEDAEEAKDAGEPLFSRAITESRYSALFAFLRVLCFLCVLLPTSASSAI
jgi:hypothetical protein